MIMRWSPNFPYFPAFGKVAAKIKERPITHTFVVGQRKNLPSRRMPLILPHMRIQRFKLVLRLFCLLMAAAASAQNTDAAKSNQPVATVAGQTIYEDDLLPTIQGQLLPLRNQEYEIKKKALDNLIDQKLLEKTAEAKDLATDQLLEQEVEPVIKDLLAKYGDKVSLAYRDLPLRQIHPQAQIAAEASRCAEEQGKFWEYHDQHFAASKLDHDSLLDYARTLKLDDKQFDSCLTAEKYKAEIDQDLREGMQAGVTGTPGFFINGVVFSGSQPKESFAKTIDEELSRKQ